MTYREAERLRLMLRAIRLDLIDLLHPCDVAPAIHKRLHAVLARMEDAERTTHHLVDTDEEPRRP